MHRFALLAALCLAVLVGACGGGGAADADPAAGVPRDALFYMEMNVRPEGDLRSGALEAGGKVLRTDEPEARMRELLGRLGEDFDYDRDLEPWLGERLAFWVSGRQVEEGDAPVAVVIAATDIEEAKTSIDESRKRSGDKFSQRSHAGVDYELDDSGFGVAYLEDFVLLGSEPELKRTIDAVQGDGLADDEKYERAIDGLEEERLAHFYVDTRRLLELARASDPEAEAALGQIEALVPLDKLPPAAGAFMADGSQLTLDVQVDVPRTAELGALVGGGGSTPLLEEVPADSWYAQGNPRLGETLRATLQQFGGALAQRQFEQQLGIDLDRDVLSWAGDAAFFLRGESPDTFDAGIVIEVTDEDAAAGAFGRIVGGLRSRARLNAVPVNVQGAEVAFEVAGRTPQPIVLARGDGKVVVAYGLNAATAALASENRLGGSERHERALEVLGDGLEPSHLLWLPSVAALVYSSSAADPEWSQAKPYLEAYDVLAIGGAVRGGEARVRIATGLR